jgi:transcriptional regulator with XRE-family HTH domain
MKALGEHYRQLREDAGIILSDMAVAMGIDKSTLSYLERGRRRFTTYYAIRFEAALKTLGNSL